MVVAALWAGFAALTVALAARTLPACGVALFGWRFGWCDVAAGDADLVALVREARVLETQLETVGGCRPSQPPAVAGGAAPITRSPAMTAPVGSVPPDGSGGAGVVGSPPAGRAGSADGIGGPATGSGPTGDGAGAVGGAGNGSAGAGAGPADGIGGPATGSGPTGDGAGAVGGAGNGPAGAGAADANGGAAAPTAPSALPPTGGARSNDEGGEGSGVSPAGAGRGEGAGIASQGEGSDAPPAGGGQGDGNAPSGGGRSDASDDPPGGPGDGRRSGDGGHDGAADLPRAPSSPSSTAVPSDCPPTTATNATPGIVLALDHSRSMGLPISADPVEIARLEAGMERGEPAARRAYGELVDGPGRKRIDALRAAIRASIGASEQGGDVGLLTFAGCGRIRFHGVFPPDRRDDLLALTDGLSIRPATPLAVAIQGALAEARRMSARSVVLISDGRDTCEGDPCAVARAAGTDIPIQVVLVGNDRAAACVATATGGRVFESTDARDLRAALASALSSARTSRCR